MEDVKYSIECFLLKRISILEILTCGSLTLIKTHLTSNKMNHEAPYGASMWLHEHSIKKLANLNIPKSSIKNLVKSIHKSAITYLTYLVLNK